MAYRPQRFSLKRYKLSAMNTSINFQKKVLFANESVLFQQKIRGAEKHVSINTAYDHAADRRHLNLESKTITNNRNVEKIKQHTITVSQSHSALAGILIAPLKYSTLILPLDCTAPVWISKARPGKMATTCKNKAAAL